VNKPYGRRFVAALPDLPVLVDEDEAALTGF